MGTDEEGIDNIGIDELKINRKIRGKVEQSTGNQSYVHNPAYNNYKYSHCMQSESDAYMPLHEHYV